MSTPTSAVSKNSTGCRISVRNSSALVRAGRGGQELRGRTLEDPFELRACTSLCACACTALSMRMHACNSWTAWQRMQASRGVSWELPEVLYEISVQQADKEPPEPCKQAVHDRKPLRRRM